MCDGQSHRFGGGGLRRMTTRRGRDRMEASPTPTGILAVAGDEIAGVPDHPGPSCRPRSALRPAQGREPLDDIETVRILRPRADARSERRLDGESRRRAIPDAPRDGPRCLSGRNGGCDRALSVEADGAVRDVREAPAAEAGLGGSHGVGGFVPRVEVPSDGLDLAALEPGGPGEARVLDGPGHGAGPRPSTRCDPGRGPRPSARAPGACSAEGRAAATRMAVPGAAVDEDDLAPGEKDEVGGPGWPPAAGPEPRAEGVRHPPNGSLRASALAAEAVHRTTTLVRWALIGQGFVLLPSRTVPLRPAPGEGRGRSVLPDPAIRIRGPGLRTAAAGAGPLPPAMSAPPPRDPSRWARTGPRPRAPSARCRPRRPTCGRGRAEARLDHHWPSPAAARGIWQTREDATPGRRVPWGGGWTPPSWTDATGERGCSAHTTRSSPPVR